MSRKIAGLFVATVLAAGWGGSAAGQSAEPTLMAEMRTICIASQADFEGLAPARAQALGYKPLEGVPLTREGDVQTAYAKDVAGQRWMVVVNRRVTPATTVTPSQVMVGCMVAGPDPDDASAKALRAWVGVPSSGRSADQTQHLYVVRDGKRLPLDPNDNTAGLAALEQGGFWIMAIHSDGDQTRVVLALAQKAR